MVARLWRKPLNALQQRRTSSGEEVFFSKEAMGGIRKKRGSELKDLLCCVCHKLLLVVMKWIVLILTSIFSRIWCIHLFYGWSRRWFALHELLFCWSGNEFAFSADKCKLRAAMSPLAINLLGFGLGGCCLHRRRSCFDGTNRRH